MDEYARLLVEMGVNVQEGEPVLVTIAPEHYEFARLLAKHAYRKGASEVLFTWIDPMVNRMTMEHSPLDVLANVPQWAYDRLEFYYKKGANIINASSPRPGLMEGLDPEKISKVSAARSKKFHPLQPYTMNDVLSWTIGALPNPDWAKLVFPDIEDEEEACNKLWDLILEVSRMNNENPIQAWEDHINRLQTRAEKMNEWQFDSLHYQSSNGTDLVVGLPKNHLWLAASSKNAKGTQFIPNIPTEEIFTAPHKDRVSGRIKAVKPLVYQDQVIKDMEFEFKDGKCVSCSASQNEEVLKKMLAQDQGASYLGEVALVPYDSPISNSKTLFFSTLFDENASCHLAFGASYPTCIEGGTDLEEKELAKRGGNSSIIHVDFMVGAKDMNITGTTPEGEEIPVFIDGNFAF